MNPMKIFQKLSLVFLSSAFLLGGVGLISLRGNTKAKINVDRAILKGNKTTKLIADIYSDLRKLESETYNYIWQKKIGRSDEYLEQDKQKILEIIPLLSKKILDLDLDSEELLRFDLNSPIELENEEEQEGEKLKDELDLIRIADKLQEKNLKLKQTIKEILETNNINRDRELISNELETLFNHEIYPLLERYQTNFYDDQKEKTEVITTYLNNNDLIIGSSTGVALILSFVLSIYTIYTISLPLEKLKDAALSIGKGQLNVQVPIFAKDEIGILAQSFNQMISGLKDTTVSKYYLDRILSSMVDSLIVLSADGTIKKVNPATCQLLGYQKTELIDRNFQLILSDSSFKIEDLTQEASVKNFDLTYQTKQGKEILIAFSSSIIQNKSGEIEGIVCLARDITEKKQTEKALRESEERYALASRAANDGLWDWNLISKEIYFSPRWKYLLGYQDRDIQNNPEEWFSRIHPQHLEQVSQAIISYLQNPHSPLEISYQILHKDGDYRWMLCRAIVVKNDQGEISRLTGSQTDITTARAAEEQLRHQALYDGLTGLPNRSFFLDKLKQSFARCNKNPQEMFAVLFLDLDGFKKINDSLGHLVGDQLLVNFSRRFQEYLRNEDTFARLGGDEFAILMDNLKELKDAINLAERISQQLEQCFRIQGRELFVTASIGIAPSTNNYSQVEDLLRDADTAMYQAKASGKARYTVFQPRMYLEAVHILELESDLRKAIEREQFEVFYQPIVKLNNREIVGFEALVRWQHPSRGLISPIEFIPMAEETGLILPIGYWVMEQACRQMRIWQEKYQIARKMTVSVNLSPVQLKHFSPDHPFNCLDRIQTIIQKTGLQSHSLKLEITENTIMESLDRANSILEQIQALGIKLSMDDFGTGYSSLNYLHHLSLDTLKIDKSFIREIDINTDKLKLIRTIVDLAQTLKMDIIAEGVETIQQQILLTELNCEYGQGYLFAKPLPSTDAQVLIATTEQLGGFFSKVETSS